MSVSSKEVGPSLAADVKVEGYGFQQSIISDMCAACIHKPSTTASHTMDPYYQKFAIECLITRPDQSQKDWTRYKAL